MQNGTVFPIDTIHRTKPKGTRCPDSHPANVYPCLFALRHNGLDYIACLETADPLELLWLGAGEPVLVHPAHLP